MEKDAISTSSETIGLKKRVGLVGGMSLIVGSIVGSGIFISPKGVLAGAGSVGLSLILWIVCGVISTLGALSYAELGTMITDAGGEYAYLYGAFGAVPAFLFSWMSMLVLRPAILAIIALTCAEYVMVPMFEDQCGVPPSDNIKLTCATVLSELTTNNADIPMIAIFSQVIFTAAKLIALCVIIIGGVVKIAQGNTQYLETGFEGTEDNPGRIAIGLYNGMWAYDGWNTLNFVTEELINPNVNLPRSIIVGMPVVIVLYLLVNISYFSVMSVGHVLDSPAVALTWAELVIPDVAWIMPVFVALSTFGAANGALFSSGRLTFAAARNGHMLESLSMVDVKNFTPIPSLVFVSILSILYTLPGQLGSLIDLFNFAVWFFYGGTAASLVYMRYFTKYKDFERPYKVPIIIPIIVVIVSVFLVLAPIIDEPQIEYLFIALFFVVGLVFYVPFVHYEKHPPFMSENIRLIMTFESF
ncbi:hypothetical protein CAPTEDRAFT_123368 [Capitella teleta]|uniref:b(0,+)-type amino acid transporter 1 n=1 Tax=Capitella teleta TaxID=283909 RepID=R7V117_CAPTE|nr:hypothetical protein CAPTEDRAFT_123368 [Capitella teleta]|eukprot:ELU12167.1 hypothetical protein CAPTEDRAFT_123368 [Capitella teleta]